MIHLHWKKGSDMRLYVMLMFLGLYLLFFGMVASSLMNNDRVVKGLINGDEETKAKVKDGFDFMKELESL